MIEIIKECPSERMFKMELEIAKEHYNVISYRYKDWILKMEVEPYEQRSRKTDIRR